VAKTYFVDSQSSTIVISPEKQKWKCHKPSCLKF
jgi:hypothetical protein